MSAGPLKTGGWRGVVVVRHFVALRDESDALVGTVRERSRILVQFYGHAAANALRQMQAAARNVKGAGVAAGTGFTGSFLAQYSIDQRSGADKKR